MMSISRFYTITATCLTLIGSTMTVHAEEAAKVTDVLPEYRAALEVSLENAGTNRVELETALEAVPQQQRKAMQFLIAHMPESDATVVSAEFLLNNVAWAFKARETYPWAKQVPEAVFLNDVLPYANLDERRDDWREDFFNRFSKHVKTAQTQQEALDAVNREILKEVEVDYSIQREKSNQSPYESMRQGIASCTGLSILLSDAFRAVGIPARIAGTPAWTTKQGNHSWVEVWTAEDQRWHFTEYHPDGKGLDHGWLVADAARGNAQSLVHSIYATSWKPTGQYFPMVWDMKNTGVHALNVTERYVELGGEAQAEDDCELRIHRMVDGQRVAVSLVVRQGDLKIAEGVSPKSTDDMNHYYTLNVRKGQLYQVIWKDQTGAIQHQRITTPKDKDWLVVELQDEE